MHGDAVRYPLAKIQVGGLSFNMEAAVANCLSVSVLLG